MKSNEQMERRDGQNSWRQNAVGLLLLTLLMASPLQGRAQGVINFNSTSGVDLYSYFGPSVHTVTVNPGYTINNTYSGLDAITGEYQPWHLINNGTLNGYFYGYGGDGVYFGKGGSVNNTGNIYGDMDGIYIYGDSGSVVNSGNITGYYYDGIYFDHGGSVNNLSGGYILGEGDNYDGGAGVEINGGAGSVNNAGIIESYRGLDGVYMDQGGSVSNTGSIYGSGNGVEIYGGPGSVVNTSEIYGYDGNGIYMDWNGSVSNTGSIYGYDNGVSVSGPGYVVNNGYIYGGYDDVSESVGKRLLEDGGSDQSYAGVYFGNGGVVINNGTIVGGTDHGNSDGVYITGGLGFVTNSGVIYGSGDDGVELNAGGVVNNQRGGFIGGSINGVDINGPATVINHGTISGEGTAGVYLNQGGFVYNGRSGGISGNFNGVEVYGNPGIVVNHGSITGTNRDGIYMDQGGVVVNQTSQHHGNYSGNNNETASITDSQTASGYYGNTIPTITGGDYGVQISGDVGTVINSGTIIGTNNAGVLLEQGGTVVNQTSQHHRNNSGNDDATTSDFNGNNIPTISGGNNGVVILGGLGFVTNSGSISGGNIAGVWLADGGIVVNQSSQRHGNNRGGDYETASLYNGNNIPTIEGGDFGVLITGSTNAVVINSGMIIGTNNAGVRLEKGGTVINQTSRHHGDDYETASSYNGNNIPTISGGNNGVVIVGGTGYVYNDGVISATQINNTPTTAGSSDSAASSDGTQTPPSIIGNGVIMSSGGTVDNGRHGTIEGYNNGVVILGGPGYVSNKGNISVVPVITPVSSGPVVSSAGVQGPALISGNGIYMGDGGTVDNHRRGTISGDNNGVVILGDTGNVSNDGDISGVPVLIGSSPVISSAGPTVQALPPIVGNGVYLGLGGTVDNGRRGTIEGGYNGVEIIGGPGSVSNDGKIYGGESFVSSSKSIALNAGSGVYLGDGGTVENGRHAGIYGYDGYGIQIYGGAGVVVDSGYISGGNGTAIQMATALTSGFSNSVTLKSHSEVIGNIDGGGNGADAAFLQGKGQYDYGFTNFATLTVDAWGCRGWNLTGTNYFSTSATVESGRLRVNGELNTPLVTVDEGAILAGAGVINGIVDNHGDFAPGNSISNLTINGSMTNGGNYQVQLNTTTNDFILVNGTATITGGNVIVQPDRQIYGSNTVYTILTATNGVVGAYVTNYIEPQFWPYTALFLTSSLSNDLDNVYLTLHRSKFTTVARTYNQNSVAGALDGIVDTYTPAMSNLVSEMFWMPSAGAARAALDSLSGEIHGTLGMLDVQQQAAFNNSIAQRTGRMSASSQGGGTASSLKPVQLASAGSSMPAMQQAQAVDPLDIWLQGFGSFGELHGDGNAQGGDFTISGLSGGLDYRLCPQMLVGLGVGYSHNDATVGGPNASGKVDAIQFAGYGGYVDGPWHLDGIVSYGFLRTDTKRFINVGSISQEADGKYNGGVLSLSAEGGYAFVFDWLTVEPTIGLDYAHLWQDSFSETGIATDGNNYGLNVKNVNMDSFRSALGVRLAAQFGKKDGVQFIPAARAVWQHEFVDRYADLNASFVGGSGDFNVRGVELGADSGVLGAGLTVAFNKAIQGFVNYDANLNSQLSSHTISGGLSLSW